MSAPRGFKDPAVIAERETMLDDSRHEGFRSWTAELQAKQGALIPWFDPADGGFDAQVLILLEAPGPMTNAENKRPGSGFISVDNDDATAQELWKARDAVGLDAGTTLIWNIVPWYLGVASVKPSAAELGQGAQALLELMPLMPHLHTVVLSGRFSQHGWHRHVAGQHDSYLRVISTWHPSPLAMAAPGRREEFRAAIGAATERVWPRA